jgi:hypothetical protein
VDRRKRRISDEREARPSSDGKKSVKHAKAYAIRSHRDSCAEAALCATQRSLSGSQRGWLTDPTSTRQICGAARTASANCGRARAAVSASRFGYTGSAKHLANAFLTSNGGPTSVTYELMVSLPDGLFVTPLPFISDDGNGACTGCWRLVGRISPRKTIGSSG